MAAGRRGTAVLAVCALVVAAALAGVALAAHRAPGRTLAVPEAWRSAWQAAHVREGRAVVLAWGDALGADPTTAPPARRFDPDRAVAQLDALYALDVDALRVVRADGPIARHKVVVVVDGTWSSGPGSAGAASPPAPLGGLAAPRGVVAGTVVDGVGLLRADPAALRGAAATSGLATGAGTDFDPAWQLARAFAQVVQGFAALDGPGGAFASDAARTFWPASAAYLASLAAPGEVGDLADLVRAPQLRWGSARLGEAGWLLLEYLADRDGDQLVGDLWRQAEASDDPLSAYRRIADLSGADLARRVTEYAMRTVTWDFSDNSAIAHALAGLDPALLTGRTTPVTTVADDPGHYAVLDAFAPADYGFDVVRLRPDAPLATIRLHLVGRSTVPGAALSVGLVAVRNGVARYSPVTTGADTQVQFALRAGETQAYLVVAGTPATARAAASTSGVGDVPRYPFDVRISGASVADDATLPAPPGMHRHANGGGLVDDLATVADTAYVGPDAVVRGDAHVLGQARIEGRAWVEGGAVVTGNAVVRDVAVVRSGSVLGAGVVVGGDAVVQFTCTAGTYVAYDPRRGCDGTPGRPDVNPVLAPLPADRLTLTGPTAQVGASSVRPPAPQVTPPTGTGAPTGAPRETPGQPAGGGSASGPRGGGSTGGRSSTGPAGAGSTGTGGSTAPPAATTPPAPPAGGGVAPPEPVQSSPCRATYRVTTTWTGADGQAWFEAEVRVSGTGDGVLGWSVGWSLAPGVQIPEAWNAQVGVNGRAATAENESYNGIVRPGQDVVFGFHGTAPSEAVGRQVPSVSCTPTR